MLITKIREGIKTPFVKGFLLVLLITLFGGFGIFTLIDRAINGDRSAALIINKQGIHVKTLFNKKQEMRERIESINQLYGAMAPYVLIQMGLDQDPEKAARKDIVSKTIASQAADKARLYFSDQVFQDKLNDVSFLHSKLYHLAPRSIYTQSGILDVDAFNTFLASLDMGKIEQDLQVELRHDLLFGLLESNSWIPRFVFDQVYNSRLAQKKFKYATLSFDYFLKEAEAQAVSDETLKAFYEKENKKKDKRYFIPTSRMGTAWVVDAQNFPVKVTESEVRNYYNKAKQTAYVKKPAEVKVRIKYFDDVENKGLIALKKEAETFHAKSMQDKTLLEKEGKLYDYFSRGKGPQEKLLERVAFRLKEDGAISNVIDLGEKGYAVVQRVGRKERVFKSF